MFDNLKVFNDNHMSRLSQLEKYLFCFICFPQALILEDHPKIQKVNIPIRPVVSYKCVPANKLAKKILLLGKNLF